MATRYDATVLRCNGMKDGECGVRRDAGGRAENTKRMCAGMISRGHLLRLRKLSESYSNALETRFERIYGGIVVLRCGVLPW